MGTLPAMVPICGEGEIGGVEWDHSWLQFLANDGWQRKFIVYISFSFLCGAYCLRLIVREMVTNVTNYVKAKYYTSNEIRATPTLLTMTL